MDAKDEPFRSAPASPVDHGRPFARRRHWGRLAAATVAVAAGPIGILLFSAAFGFDWLGTADDRRRAEARLRSLPFPITHDGSWSVETGTRARAIVSATIRLKDELGGRDLARWCSAVTELAPRLSVIASGSSIALTRWPWRSDDVLLLAQLLDAWGRPLDAAQGIHSVEVRWARASGPPAGI